MEGDYRSGNTCVSRMMSESYSLSRNRPSTKRFTISARKMKEPNVIMDKLAVVLFLAAVVVVALAGAEEEPATQQKVRAERRDQASYAVELC